ncbi:MAG: DinB family protein [Vicinamibacterales bacterium]
MRRRTLALILALPLAATTAAVEARATSPRMTPTSAPTASSGRSGQAGQAARSGAAAKEEVTMTMAGSVRREYVHLKDLLTASAELMPAESYAFRPAPEMRTFAGVFGHILSANLSQCGSLVGRTHARAGEDLSKTLTTKAEVVALARETFAFCDEFFLKLDDGTPMEDAWRTMEGRQMGEPVTFKVSNGANAMHFMAHNNEQYGYLAVYLRLKGLTPPSSAPRPATGGEPSR